MDGMGNAVRIVEPSPRLDAAAEVGDISWNLLFSPDLLGLYRSSAVWQRQRERWADIQPALINSGDGHERTHPPTHRRTRPHRRGNQAAVWLLHHITQGTGKGHTQAKEDEC